ncbi:MAG: hypothetical protein PUE85_01040 [Firmicutes bacterium]|nr:hypothetical protein [Bacillota bacterium]
MIYIAAFAVLILIGLLIFNDFLSVYERSRPDNEALDYINEIGGEGVKNIMLPAYPKRVSELEDAERVYDEVIAPFLLSGNLSVRKLAGKYSENNPVYAVVNEDGKKLFSISLEKSAEKDKYGFPKWSVVSAQPFEGIDLPEPFDYSITAPADAVVSVNGVELSDGYILSDMTGYRKISEYEKGTDSEVFCSVYKVSGLYFAPDAEAVYNGEKLSCATEENTYFFDYPESAVKSVTVTVPADAELSLNGKKVGADDEFTKAEVEDITVFESAENVYMKVYRFSGLFSEPKITVSRKGILLEGQNGFYSVPEDEKYSPEITVPEGAVVKINGVVLDEKYISGEGTEYRLLEKLGKFFSNPPTLDMYCVSGLYNEPQVEASLNGKPLRLIERKNDEQKNSYEFVIDSDDNRKDEIKERAESFLESYVYFSAMGNSNIQENHKRVMSYMLAQTPSYSIMNQAYYSIIWNKRYDRIKYNSVETDNFIYYTDNCISCDISFDVSLSRIGSEYNYKDVFTLVFIKYGGEWMVGNIVFYGGY